MKNYKKILKDACDLVANDFCATSEMKLYSGEAFTQEEARHMAEIIAKLYKVVHCVGCRQCGKVYEKTEKKEGKA